MVHNRVVLPLTCSEGLPGFADGRGDDTGTSRGDVGERIIAHLAFARAVAARSLDPRCRGADREDLIAWGLVGLVQGARRDRM
jgi:hypothetical protein